MRSRAGRSGRSGIGSGGNFGGGSISNLTPWRIYANAARREDEMGAKQTSAVAEKCADCGREFEPAEVRFVVATHGDHILYCHTCFRHRTNRGKE